MSETPSTGIPYVPQNVLDPAAGINAALDHIDALLQSTVLSMALTSPPASAANGDQYIVAATGSGAWAGHTDDLARYVAEGSFWQFFTAGEQVRIVLNEDDGGLYAYIGGAWVPAVAGSGGGGPGSITVVGLDDSPPVVVTGVETIYVEGATVAEETGGAVRLTVDGGLGSAVPTIIDLGMFFPGTPGSSQLMFKFVAVRPFTFPANFDGARGHIGTNPTASFAMSVEVAGVVAGTITISTGGVFTFATTGSATFAVDAGDEIEIIAPSSTDATAADIAATLTADLD